MRGTEDVPTGPENSTGQFERERELRQAVERELAATRSSEAFRIGERLVVALRGWSVVRRWTSRVAQLGASGTAAPPALSAPETPAPRRPATSLLVVAVGEVNGGLPDALPSLVDALATNGIVLVTDAHFDDTAFPGVTVERVIPLVAWQRHRPTIDWGPHVTRSVAAAVQHYRPSIVMCGGGGELAGLLATLAPLLLPGMEHSEGNAL